MSGPGVTQMMVAARRNEANSVLCISIAVYPATV